jgi:hypothetical protein
MVNTDGGHAPFNAAEQVFLIGNTYYSDNGSFSGLIEYPRVFNVALTDAQIKAAANDQPIPP